MNSYGEAGVTQEMDTRAIAESIANPGGTRGGIHGFYERKDGRPTYQAIDDATYMQQVRKGHKPYFGEGASPDMGVHRTLARTASGRKVKALCDIEILRALRDGQTVNGTASTPERQAQAVLWLARLYTPHVSQGLSIVVCPGCTTAFRSEAALRDHAPGCTVPVPGEPDPDAPAVKPPKPATCRQCGEQFTTEGERLRHWHAEHKKAKKASAPAATHGLSEANG